MNTILIVTSEPFPKGMAATNRILSYAKGLIEYKQNVTVLSFKPSINEDLPVDGIYNDVKYSVLTRIPKISNHKILNIYHFAIGLLYSMKFFRRSTSSKRLLILVSNKPFLMFYFYFISKLFNYKFLQEKSEFPFVLNRKSFLGKGYAVLYTNLFYKLFDGFIVMTKPLYEYFSNKKRKNAKLLLLPMTVETDRFKHGDQVYDFEYIAYCGYMGNNKDGVDNLITSFALIANKFPELKLVLIGDGPQNEIQRFRRIVNDKRIDRKVIFTGRVNREDMPNYLCNAKVLALARPLGLQSTGGFPTKLGEYLSTGKPVVVTSVGDIPEYLENNRNAFLCEPDNPILFAECIEKVLNNYSNALKVGIEGRNTALECFNYKKQSYKLLVYLNSI